MGRRERELAEGPLKEFAQRLRDLREAAGRPTYRAMERRAGYSASALSAAAGGERLPTLAVTLAYVGACGGDMDAWDARWRELAQALQAAAPEPSPEPPAGSMDYARDTTQPAIEPLGALDPASVGPFTLVGRLGSGSMGQVFLGHTPGGHKVAVKVVHPALAADRRFRRRFARELEAVRRVQGLFTAPLVDADARAEQPWLATVYVPGPTLAQQVRADGPLQPAQVAVLAAGIAEALTAIHAAGLVHRDLKPSNVILAEVGPRVIDFGIARTADATNLTMTGAMLGSAAFTAPELVRGEPATAATDVFSLGCLLVYALTGAAPFGEDTAASVLYRVAHTEPDLSALPRAGNGLRSLIGDCLAKDPAARPTPGEIVARLRPDSIARADRQVPGPNGPAITGASIHERRALTHRAPAALLLLSVTVIATAGLGLRYAPGPSAPASGPSSTHAAGVADTDSPGIGWTAYSGPGCASRGAAPLSPYDSPQAAGRWRPTAVGAGGFANCGSALRSGRSGSAGSWLNDADWVFTPPRQINLCRFEVYIPPGAWARDVLYEVYLGDASNGYNGPAATSFDIDQARYDSGGWTAAGPAVSLTSGIVDLNITDAGTDGNSQVVADLVRATCT